MNESDIFATVGPEVKQQAESILNELGITMSEAVGIFLRQVVIQRGLPFALKLPAQRPLAAGELTKEQFDTKLANGMTDIENDRVYSVDEVEEEMHRLYGI